MTGARSPPTSRCSPTACGPSGSRASRSTLRTGTSRRRGGSSSSPTRQATSSTPRNMVTGASTADLAIILVDARNGLNEQSRRHAFLTTLLRVPHLVLAVNKMDLVGYDQQVFEQICDEFSKFATKLEVQDLTFIPISALLRRQRGGPQREHALVRGPVAAAPPGASAHRVRPQPDRRAVPRPVRDPAARLQRPGTPRLPRLRRPGGGRRAQARRRGDAPAVRVQHQDQADRAGGQARRRGVPADVGDPAARRRRGHLPR